MARKKAKSPSRTKPVAPTIKARVGRKPKLVPDEKTLEQIRALARMQCTQAEAGAVLGVSRETFSDYLRHNDAMREAWNIGPDAGKASLRRIQWKQAERSVTMAIWLGKQYLGQKDVVTQTLELQGKVTVSDARERFTQLIDRLATTAGAGASNSKPH